MIRTILKDIESCEIRHAQCHEHLFVEKGASFNVSKSLYMDNSEATCRELSEYRNAGGSLVVDAQPGYFGRMAEKLADASLKSGVDIVASTGFHKICFCDNPDFFTSKSDDELSKFFVSELTEGMISSKAEGYKKLNQKAGIIKTAVESQGIESGSIYEKLFSAAAKAQIQTGFSILCHIEKGADAISIIDFFTERGVQPGKIIICHLDRAQYDFEYHKKVAGMGVFLDYDSINRLKYISGEDELKLICQMIDAGFSDRLLFALDTTNERLSNYGGYMSLSYILETYIPLVKKAGVSDNDIKKMTCTNACQALSV